MPSKQRKQQQQLSVVIQTPGAKKNSKKKNNKKKNKGSKSPFYVNPTTQKYLSNRLRLPMSVVSSFGRSEQEMKYLYALTDPFNPLARGAKCLVYPARNTTSYTISWSAQFTPISSTRNELILVPNPMVFGWGTVDATSVAPLVCIDGSMSQCSYSAGYGLNGSIVDSGNTNLPLISNVLSNYRVVGGGFKIRGAQSTSGAQFHHVIAPLPLQNPDFLYQMVNGNVGTNSSMSKASTANFWSNGGQGMTFVEKSYFGAPVMYYMNLQAQDNSVRFTNYSILNSEVECVFKICGPDAFEFKDTTDVPPSFPDGAANTVNTWDFGTIVGSGVTYGRRGSTDVSGWEGFVWQTNVPSSTSVSCYIDYILHLEGTPLAVTPGQLDSVGNFTSNYGNNIMRYAKAAESILRIGAQIAPILSRNFAAGGPAGQIMNYLGLSDITNAQFFHNRGIPRLTNG